MAFLAITAVASFAGLFFSLIGDLHHAPRWARAGHYSIYAVLAATVAAMLVLLAAFLSRDFGNAYVFAHSSRALSVP